MFGRKRRIEEATAVVRRGYDRAIVDAGVILFQQVADGTDGHYVSSSIVDLLGWDATAFRTPGTLRRIVHPDDLATFRTAAPITRSEEPAIDLRGLLDDQDPTSPGGADDAAEPVVRFLTAAGDYRSMAVRMVEVGVGEPARGSLIDASVGAAEHQRVRRLAEVAEASHHGHLLFELVDRDDPSSVTFRAANGTARRLFDLDPALLDGGRLEQVFDGPSVRLLRSALFDVAHTGESLTAQRLSFAEVPGTFVDLRIDRLADGSLGVTIDDVTAAMELEERMRFQAMHDHLTGLPNRLALDERLALVATGLGASEHIGVILVDVDGLDELNRTFGHHVGDRILIELGRRLSDEVSGVDMVARIGGNEFTLLTVPGAQEDEVLERARSVQQVMDRPVDVDGDLRSVRCTIGTAIAPQHGQDPATLLRAADGALRQARSSADVLAVFHPQEERSLTRRVGLLTELRKGLANQELGLRYQPVVDLRTGRVTKVEAVLRWERSAAGPRHPRELVEMAHRSGLIEPLTRWVLGESARAAERIGRDHDAMVVSTDLSMHHLHHDELLSFIELLVTSGELPPATVEIEVTEPDLAQDPVRGAEVLRHLNGLGISVAVDDFGTGHLPLETMESMPVHSIKIDRGFTTAVTSVEAEADAVASTIELAHGLGLAVTAVGVPDASTLGQLTVMGCDHAQGVHLSEAVTFEDLPRRVTELEVAMSTWVGAAAVVLD